MKAPPRPRCCLNVGVTGHRGNRLSQPDLDLASPALEKLLRAMSSAIAAWRDLDTNWFEHGPAELRVLSGLAEGSDRHVAALAINAGYKLHAVLPFQRDTFAADFESAESQAGYRRLLESAERVFELPGDRAETERAYAMAGRALVAHSDMLIALWDGHEARGPGGTGAVVERALRRGLPVIHLQPGTAPAMRVIWSGFGTLTIDHARIVDYPSVACDEAVIAEVMERILLPDKDSGERASLATFFYELERRYRFRIEYPLLLALTGVRKMSWAAWRAPPYLESTERDWNAFRSRVRELGMNDTAPALQVQHAYAWCDHLANYFAQVFRSSHLLNFVLAAVAVVLAVSGLVWPAAKLWLIVGELAVISLVVINTYVGRSREWHRRWLDYRYLAECLRPMRSLNLFGLANAGARKSSPHTQPLRWPDWYAQSIWRQMGCPSGCVDLNYAAGLNKLIVAEELRPQIDYHRLNAQRMHALEHRLHRLGTALFVATIGACVAFLGGYFIAHDWTVARAPLVTAITAALPALGGAIYGIRVHGDFGGSAHRSLRAAAELQRLSDAFEGTPAREFTRAALLAESTARLLLSDLDEWQLTYRQRGLDIPA